jgi:RNA-splicing ligase RtcB
MSGLAKETPVAYKDAPRVVGLVERAGMGKKLTRLEPIAVINE